MPLLRIEPLAGYTPTIGRLVGMLTYSRQTLVAAVDGLTTAQLDHLHDPQANSIGALLAHAAAVEQWYQRFTFEPGSPNELENGVLMPALVRAGYPERFSMGLIAGTGTLDLDDSGAEVGEIHRRQRAGQDAAEVGNQQAGQGSWHRRVLGVPAGLRSDRDLAVRGVERHGHQAGGPVRGHEGEVDDR